MTWRAINNALAGLLAGVAGGVLLGALIVIWGVTVFTLATSTDDWEHVVVYVGIVLLITALTPWLVHGLSAMQRSRLRVTLGAEIPAPEPRLTFVGHWCTAASTFTGNSPTRLVAEPCEPTDTRQLWNLG